MSRIRSWSPKELRHRDIFAHELSVILDQRDLFFLLPLKNRDRVRSGQPTSNTLQSPVLFPIFLKAHHLHLLTCLFSGHLQSNAFSPSPIRRWRLAPHWQFPCWCLVLCVQHPKNLQDQTEAICWRLRSSPSTKATVQVRSLKTELTVPNPFLYLYFKPCHCLLVIQISDQT